MMVVVVDLLSHLSEWKKNLFGNDYLVCAGIGRRLLALFHTNKHTSTARQQFFLKK